MTDAQVRIEEERELFAAVTKHDLSAAISHLRHFGSVPQMEHREKYADLLEAQGRLIAHLLASRDQAVARNSAA